MTLINAEKKQTPLERAVELAGSQKALAEKIGGNVKQQHVSYWIRAGIVRSKYVLAIEKAVGGQVTRHELRPDLYPIRERRRAA
jgi:DNA-binding transcriptional regulator YdaS (Cro superfamily)